MAGGVDVSYRNNAFAILFFMLVARTLLISQEKMLPQDTVAHVGPEVITSVELLKRIELMPFPENRQPDQAEEIKSKALYSMIAEKLLATEARHQQLPEDHTTNLMRHELENLLIRDALFKREVEEKARPAERDIYDGMKRYRIELTVLSFLVSTEVQGKILANRLRETHRDSLLKDLPTGMYSQLDTIKIHFGGPDTAYEDAAYAIGKSRVSKPFYSSTLGWAVLYLLESNSYAAATKMNIEDRHRHVEKVLRERLMMELSDQYSREVLKNRTAAADSTIFNIFSDSILALWHIDPEHFHRDNGYIITSDMIDVLLERLVPLLDTTFVKVEDGNLTLGDILEMMRYEGFEAQSYEGLTSKFELNEEVKHVVGRELLAREGRKKLLQYSNAVLGDLSMWMDYWSARQLFYRVRDSIKVTDQDVYNHLLKNKEMFGSNYSVNIREILSDDLGGVSTIMQAIGNGKNLADLAGTYSKRTEWASRGGESGLFKILDHPELGFRALLADTGKLVGPLKLKEGYSLFTVLRKQRTNSAIVSFDTLRDNIEKRLITEKRKDTVDRFIASLAREQHVTIDSDKLKRVKPTLIPMFTRRYMGFGGMMSATPLLMRQWDWMKEYQKHTQPYNN